MMRVRMLTAWSLLALAAVAAAGCATSPKKKPDLPEPPESVARLQNALKHAHDAVAKEPNNAENHYRLGNALFDVESYEEARAAYEAAIKLAPEHESAYCNLGLCLRRLGLLPEAIAAYRKALSIDPNDATARYNLVLALETSGDFEGSVKELQQLVGRKPEDIQILSHLGNSLFRVERYQEAAGVFEKVLRLDPGRADHYYNLGLCFFSMKNWDAALATWLTALAHDAKHAPTNKGLAVVYWKRGDYKQAWETVSRCQALGVALDPGFIGDLQKDSGQKGP